MVLFKTIIQTLVIILMSQSVLHVYIALQMQFEIDTRRQNSAGSRKQHFSFVFNWSEIQTKELSTLLLSGVENSFECCSESS